MIKLLTVRQLTRFLLIVIHCTLFIGIKSFAQSSGTISGQVVDSLTRKPLLEASVSLLSGKDSSLVNFGITDGEGRFSFPKIAEGQYRVLVTYVGYRSRARRVSVTKTDPSPNLGAVDLVAQSQTLTEVSVQGERAPIAVKGDTLEFNAGSFKTRPNAQVEELLKKLPGVEVDRDGTVKAQGQTVTKVLVDGKPFFGNDPKMATRNLPADIIDKVQLFDQSSEQSAFSGVDDGDREKTINITTKKDKRKGSFGQQTIGVGPKPGDDARYSGRVSLNRFNNGRQISVLGMANNVNQQGFTAQDLGLGGNFGGAGQGQGGGGGGNVVRGGQGGGNFGGQNQVGSNAITQSWAAGINYRDGWGKKIDVVSSYNASSTNTLTQQSSRRENVLPSGTTARSDSSFVRNQTNGSDNTNTNHRVNLRLDYRIDSLTTIRVIPSLSWLNSSYSNQSDARTVNAQGILANSSTTNYNSMGDGFTGNNSLLLFRKFRKRGRTFSVNWNIAMNDQDNQGTNLSVNQFARSNAPISTTGTSGTTTTGQADTTGLFRQVINQRNNQQTNSMTNSVNVSYTEPLSMRQTLEFHYLLSNNHNTSNRAVNDFNEATNQYDLPNTVLSNRFVNDYVTNRAGLTWQTKRLKYTYAFGLDGQQASLSSNNLSRETNLNRTFTNLLPNALLTYNFGKQRTLRLNYRTRINAPSVNQLQPVPNNTNPLNIQLGNPDLQPEYSHNISLNFNRFEPSTFRNLFASVNASRTDNKIVNSTVFTQSGAQTTTPVNTNGYYTVNGFLVLGQPVKIGTQKTNLNLRTNLTYNSGTSFINRQENQAKNWLVGQTIGLSSNFTEKLDLNLSGNINLQSAKYSLQPQQNTTFLNQTVTLDVFYQLPLRFTFSTDVYYNHYGGNSASFNQSYTLWNATLAKQLFKQNQGELRLQVFDLLNQNQSIVRNVTDTYTEEVRSRVLNRYFMVSFVYNLRSFSAGVTPPRDPFSQPNRGGGQGRGMRRNG
ncbi:outer membrane beta-barrel family protein [Spirosoma fluviale]|uniref:Carboxypeptidase regulatory-like domain-containing protein n=1 Tax=Spirosoma fluviale TaxID=1597977 RepID=A0A286GT73_9BACT|nr:outer membrane beta-barrel family protein [Spirosoma fluviale]SOD98761.1 Carboxypeptidase regulatory-like domain-containing protein [Spirosoma fluviale]